VRNRPDASTATRRLKPLEVHGKATSRRVRRVASEIFIPGPVALGSVTLRRKNPGKTRRTRRPVAGHALPGFRRRRLASGTPDVWGGSSRRL
jgi:hypothetical protein